MRDLEIRGAGDLLGTRQHGHIQAVGFHLYTRLLADAVRRLEPAKGQIAKANGQDSTAPVHCIRLAYGHAGERGFTTGGRNPG